jgi:hypothetical protein
MIRNLQELLRNRNWDNTNLHRIAISNLSDGERKIARWWCKKYSTPLKSFGDHTIEELIIEMLEDFYEARPEEIERFHASLDAVAAEEENWDGSMPDDYERSIKDRIQKINERNRVDLSKYQSENITTSIEDDEILENLGRNLPKSTKVGIVKSHNPKRLELGSDQPVLGADEFEEAF